MQLVCDKPNNLREENNYLKLVFIKTHYDADFSLASKNDFRSAGCQNVSHQQQIFSELRTLIRAITQYELVILLGSNYLQWHPAHDNKPRSNENPVITNKIPAKIIISTQRGAWTHDPEIKSLMLYRLS